MSEKNTITRTALRSLTWLLVLMFSIVGIIAGNMAAGEKKATFVPNLALDLSGGTQIILTPIVAKGQEVLPEKVSQAV